MSDSNTRPAPATALQAPETKAVTGEEATRRELDEMRAAFAAFREVNDERLAEIETRGSADGLTGEKLARIDAALDRHLAAARRRLRPAAANCALPRGRRGRRRCALQRGRHAA